MADISRNNIEAASPEPDLLARARAVVAEVLARRGGGEFLPDDQIVAAYADLMPQLGQELTIAGQIHRAVLMARRAGRVARRLRPGIASGADPLIGQGQWGSVELSSPDQGSNDLTAAVDAPAGLGEAERGLWDNAGTPTDSHPPSPATDQIESTDRLTPSVDEELPTVQGYILLHEVATGGQATVFKAIHEATGRRVAVRVLHGIHSRARIRADREADILAALDHPNLIKVTDRGRTSAGLFFICMDYVEGYSLDEFLAPTCPRGPVNLSALLNLFIRLCRAMGQAHEQGVVHRDLKPSNIRVDVSGEPRVLDFGLARPAAGDPRGGWGAYPTLTGAGQIVGTPPWISPEQAAGASAGVGAPADVYALGVMLYAALTGEFPHPTDGTLGEVLAHIASTPPKALAGRILPRWGANIPDSLAAACGRCLAKSASDRFGSATLLAEALDVAASDVLRGPSVQTQIKAPPTEVAPVQASARRRLSKLRRWWVLGGASLAGIVAIVAIKSFPAKPPDPVAQVIQDNTPHVPHPYIEQRLGMKFVYVKPGDFLMGSRADEPRRQLDPVEFRHRVRIEHGFYMATLEVTQAQYRAVLPSMPNQRWPGGDLPVHGVTWREANEFCNQLSILTKLKYRLPTDAEWEYACREEGRFTGAYAGGQNMAEVGWYAENAGKALGVQRGGQLRPNALGLFDMHGNVREYCSDWHGPYPESDVLQPDRGGPATGTTKVTRGGDIFDQAEYCRAARRGAAYLDSGQGMPGIRVVLELPRDR